MFVQNNRQAFIYTVVYIVIMDEEKVIASYQQYKLDKVALREQFPNAYTKDETLEVLRKMYLFIKSKHFDIPKLKKRTLMPNPKGHKSSVSARCSKKRKQIQFAEQPTTKLWQLPLCGSLRTSALHLKLHERE